MERPLIDCNLLRDVRSEQGLSSCGRLHRLAIQLIVAGDLVNKTDLECLIRVDLRTEKFTCKSQVSTFSLPASMASFLRMFSRAFSRARLSSMQAVRATATALNLERMSGSGSSLLIRAAMVATMEIADKSTRRRRRHEGGGDEGWGDTGGGQLLLGERHLTDTTSENRRGHSGATFASAFNPFKVQPHSESCPLFLLNTVYS